jgi:hypothetical protein
VRSGYTSLRSSSPLRRSISPARSEHAPRPFKPHVSIGSQDSEQLRIPATVDSAKTEDEKQQTPDEERQVKTPEPKSPAEVVEPEPRQCSTPEPQLTEELPAEATTLPAEQEAKQESIEEAATPPAEAITPPSEEAQSPEQPANDAPATPKAELTINDLETPTRKQPQSAFARNEKLDFEDSDSATLPTDIAQIFAAQVTLDKQLEDAKQELAVCRDFNFVDGFKHFDTTGLGFVTVAEFEAGLKDLDIEPD